MVKPFRTMADTQLRNTFGTALSRTPAGRLMFYVIGAMAESSALGAALLLQTYWK
jgi:hypothetical protein